MRFKELSIEALEEIIRQAGISSFRAKQILTWAYGRDARSYDEMTDIPVVVREQFALAYPFDEPEMIEKQVSTDGSRKYLLRYEDGTLVETVGLPSQDGRLTVCCSSQSGCAMGCAFCATGKAGLARSLAPGEIVDQVMVVARDFGERVTNVVVMGQGEPFANYDNVLAALRIMNHPKLLNIGARHITVSTCGIVEGIRRFATEPEQFTLAVSLHAARQEVRDSIMPTLRRTRVGELRKTLEEYVEETGRRFSFEYALMDGVNDSDEDLKELVSYCKRLLCHVNLIQLNEVEGSSYRRVSREKVERWQEALEEAGIAASIRRSRGADIAGACGQLAASQGNTAQ